MKPHAARNYFKAIRALCHVSVEMIESDPTQGIKRPKAKTEHRRPWTDSEVEQYERAHPVGSKARLALALGLYTVQRLGDVIRMGRQHIGNGMAASICDVRFTPRKRTLPPCNMSTHPSSCAL
jgi:integrase